MLNFSNNTFNDIKEIKSFTKEEILKIKKTIQQFKSDNVEDIEVKNYIKSKLKISPEFLDLYSNYLNELKYFTESYLLSSENSDLPLNSYFYHIKTEILHELTLISNNMKNLNSNAQNIKRLAKINTFLDDSLLIIKNLLEISYDISSNIISHMKESKNLYDNEVNLWTEINRIKNLNYKLNIMPNDLKNWNEIKELYIFIESLNDAFPKKRKKGKEKILTFHFNEIYQYFLSREDKDFNFYTDLMHLLYYNKIFEIFQGEEFINIIERKEVIQHLEDFIRPLLKKLIEEKLQGIFIEIESFDLKEKESVLDLKSLREQKISIFLPKIVDYYILGLEKKFQERIHNVIESEKFEEIANFYYKKIDEFSSNFDEIEDWILNVERFLEPYDSITISLKKIFSNLSSEIFRRKNEYLTFIKTVKDEELRVDVRKFVNKKISEANDLIRVYEDEASLIIKEEFPQLKKIRKILKDYSSKIQEIKAEVYEKLDSGKTNDIELYQVIKLWEDNFNRKRQQLTFLISLLINKLFKSFKGLIDKEGILFATITEITEQTEKFEGLPLNFALSSYLAEKLTEEELRERISEINSKINQLNSSLGLYQVELSKLEKILTNRVKIRKGIADSDVQCTVCHKYINFVKDKVVTCPFCASTYHYLCVAFWLSKYNSCPLCQNHFLEPHSELFESEGDKEFENF